MSKLAHSCQETMDQIERDALDAPAVNDDPPSACEKCGAIEQEREIMETTYRWQKEGRPPGKGWIGPIYPHAQLQRYERTKLERFFDCKFVCPNHRVGH